MLRVQGCCWRTVEPMSQNGFSLPVSGSETTLRVLSWNIWHQPSSFNDRLPVLAAELNRLDADIVILQEAHGDNGERLARAAGYEHVCVQSFDFSGNAVLSKFPIEAVYCKLFNGGEPGVDGQVRGALFAHMAVGGRLYVVVAAHLSWGLDGGAERLLQVQAIDEWARASVPAYLVASPANQPVVVMGVDMNCEPESDPWRWLAGLGVAHGRSTTWVDAWRVAERGDCGATSSMRNEHALTTARYVGITSPQLCPDRRVDAVWTYGYAWGRPGCPVRAFVAGCGPGGVSCGSDHYAVLAELLRVDVV